MASMSHDDYGRELTDASFAELKEFLKRMDVKRGACPIIIGGCMNRAGDLHRRISPI